MPVVDGKPISILTELIAIVRLTVYFSAVNWLSERFIDLIVQLAISFFRERRFNGFNLYMPLKHTHVLKRLLAVSFILDPFVYIISKNHSIKKKLDVCFPSCQTFHLKSFHFRRRCYLEVAK